jgi:hypothetical protein
MSPVLTLENPPQLTKSTNFSHPFLQEFIKQIRLADTFGKFNNLTDQLLNLAQTSKRMVTKIN